MSTIVYHHVCIVPDLHASTSRGNKILFMRTQASCFYWYLFVFEQTECRCDMRFFAVSETTIAQKSVLEVCECVVESNASIQNWIKPDNLVLNGI